MNSFKLCLNSWIDFCYSFFQEASTLRTVLTDLTIYAITFILSLVGLLITDSFVKKHPKLLTVASVLVFVILFINNFFIPFYHGFIAEPEEHLRPAYTTHIIITCYIFLNVKHTIVALLLGFTATIAHVVVEIFITYKDRNMLYERVSVAAVAANSVSHNATYRSVQICCIWSA